MARHVPSNQVAYYAQEIKENWQKALDGIFAVCGLVAEAKQDLSTADWDRLKDELPFSESVLKKLIIIGNDSRLQEPSLQRLLPPRYSIIYVVTQLEDAQLQDALDEEQIFPRMKRADFIRWCAAKKGASAADKHSSKSAQPRLGPKLFAGDQPPPIGPVPVLVH